MGLFVLLFVAAALAREIGPVTRRHSWTLLRDDPVAAHELVTVYVGLHVDAEPVERALLLRSTPSSPKYAQWLTKTEADALMAPRGVAAVEAWLRSHNVSDVRRVNHVVRCATTVAAASRMLNTTFGRFAFGTHRIVRVMSPHHVPDAVAQHVAFVGGVSHFPRVRSVKKASLRRRFGLAITPRIIHERYNTGETRNRAANNSQSVAQFLGQFFWESDLQEFFTLFSESNLGKHPIKVGPDSGFAGVEASLDIQYIMSVGQDVKTYFWSTPGLHQQQEPFLEWVMALSNSSAPPLVNSVSYGDDEPSLEPAYMRSVNAYFALLGSRGLTLLFASGDSGVGGNVGCGPQNQFVPSFPAGAPWVTAVGGSTLADPFERGAEVAWSGSGGGFSVVWPQPAYQTAAVAHYLATAKHLPPQQQWNRTGRAYPDVAAFSTGFMVVSDLFPQPVDGTSCATPTFSGVVSLVNGVRLAAGKAPLGFLNPLLYTSGGAPNTDIVSGYNPNCNSNGFECQAGWDPVTGWGSPDFAKFTKLAMSLP